jgi:hypothetical protein
MSQTAEEGDRVRSTGARGKTGEVVARTGTVILVRWDDPAPNARSQYSEVSVYAVEVLPSMRRNADLSIRADVPAEQHARGHDRAHPVGAAEASLLAARHKVRRFTRR